VATAVQLRFNVDHSSLPKDIKSRLRIVAGSRLTTEGILVIDAREHRTQVQNREAARARLIALIQQASKRPKKRRPTKVSQAAREKRLTSKKKRAQLKAARGGKPRADE
jgi:ribosome-associated protein